MSLEFLLTSLLVIVVPGTGVLYTLAIGLNHGFRTSVSAAFGCTLGIIPAATTVILGLSAIFKTSALAFQVIKRAFGRIAAPATSRKHQHLKTTCILR